MMQHLATQKAETAADLLFNRQQQEQKHSERGQEFAEVMQRNRAEDPQKEASDNTRRRAQQNNQQSASRQRVLENERRETAQLRAREQSEEISDARTQMEHAVEKSQTQSGDTQQNLKRTDTGSQTPEQTKRQTENDSTRNKPQDVATNQQAQTDNDAIQSEQQLADSINPDAQMDGDGVSEGEINALAMPLQITDDRLIVDSAGGNEFSKTAEEFDWLSMLDKLHGKHQGGSDEKTQFDEQTGIDDSLVDTGVPEEEVFETEESAQENMAIHAADILKNFADIQVKADDVVETDNITDPEAELTDPEAELTDQESLTNILAMLDQLRSKEDASDEEVMALDNMIQGFMAKHPELAGSPLQQYDSKDWLKLDSRLLEGIITSATNISPVTGAMDKQILNAEGDLAQGLMSADAQQLQKATEHLARNILPKELNNADNRATFVDSLKVGLEEMKVQLKSDGETNADLSQVVKDALATIEGVSKADINSARLQQTLATSAAPLDVTNGLSDPKTGLVDTLKSQGSVSVKDNTGTITQVELNKQQQTGQMERLVNMHKPEAAQQMVDKVQVMMNQKSLVADIRLDPPHLGGMKIRVDMSGEAASVNFVVQTQQAREALEQATPRLRELLDEQGIELGQSSVEQEAKQQSNANGNEKMASRSGGTDQDDFEEDLPEAQTVNVVNGSVNGIDYFA